LFCGLTYTLASVINVYAAPVAMLIAFGLPAGYMFVASQLGKKPVDFPYREVLKGFLLAAAIAAVFLALPEMGTVISLVIAGALSLGYLAGLVVFRVIPENHWKPLVHMARSTLRGSTVSGFNPRAGIRSIPEAQRKPLRRAIKKGIPEERLRGGKGEELVGILRRLGDAAGVPGVVEPTERDEEISVYLFERAPTAVRNASMRRLLSDGAPSVELRALEDLTNHLRRVPNDAWEGVKKNE
jgi:hypothetical protein